MHVKTHWELAGEYEFDTSNELSNGGPVFYKQAGVTMGTSSASSDSLWYGINSDDPNERPPSFISKKFTVPKKFRNVGTS